MIERYAKFETVIIAARNWAHLDLTATVVIILFVIFIATVLIGGFFFQQIIKIKQKRSYFLNLAKEQELTKEEANFIWEHAKKAGSNPVLALEFKNHFEKAVDHYINSNPKPNHEMIAEIRKKLGFNVMYSFVPITISKDIDMFQNGRMIAEGNNFYDVAVYDKDEKYMHWVVINPKNMAGIEIGKKIKISFLRKGDGIYNFESTIDEIYKDGPKTILKIPHVANLVKTQRRDSPRIEVDMPALVGEKKEIGGKEEFIWHPGKILDLSLGGVKFCIPISLRNSIKIKIASTVKIKFELKNKEYELNTKVQSKAEQEKNICFGLKFDETKNKKIEKIIYSYIKEEQIKLAKLAKMHK